MVAPWQQDTADYSWTLVDDDGCFYRAANAVDENLVRRWTIAWTEGDPPCRVRMGTYSYPTAETAKAAIENLAVIADEEAA